MAYAVAAMKKRKKRKKKEEEQDERIRKLEEEVEKIKKQLERKDWYIYGSNIAGDFFSLERDGNSRLPFFLFARA